jgi:radical SAM protein with 4Fe4S-binding SPASM domain
VGEALNIKNEAFDPDIYFDRALESLNNEMLHEALSCFRRAFQYGKLPEFIPSLIELAKCFISRELWREAEESLLEALRVDPDNPEAYSMINNLHSLPERFYDIKPHDDKSTIARKKRKTVISDVPLAQLFIELTNKCNGKCITCLNRSMRRQRGTMDFGLFKKIVDESCSSMYLEMVHLYGVGEDYLIPDVKKYFDYAVKKYSERGIKTVLITNGELITDLPAGLSVVDISFNGGKKESYERITGMDFEKTVKNIWRLERQGQLDASRNIHMLVFKDNEEEVEDFKKLFAFTGASLVLAHKFDNQCGEIDDKTVQQYHSGHRIPCHYVRNVLNIAWNGDVILCPHDFEGTVNYGNVRDQSIKKVWYSNLHKEMLKKHSARCFNGLCKKCNFNIPIEGKNIIVSKEERIEIRKRHLEFAIEEMVACPESSSCKFVQRYREHMELMEGAEYEPLIRICSDDYRFYGVDAVTGPHGYKNCPELEKLREKIKHLRVDWESPTFGPSGYAFAARGYMTGLADISAKVRPMPIWGDCRIDFKNIEEGPASGGRLVNGFIEGHNRKFRMHSPVDQETIERLLKLSSASYGTIHVIHHTPTDLDGRDFFGEFREKKPGMQAYIGYTTFETDGIPAPWVESCNRMDEIWVPSRFNVETFANAGVRRNKLHVIPHGFDPKYYQPDKTEPLVIGERKGFNFLSIFEWTYRKGWDVLIKAYLEEFRPDEDVRLIIRSYQGGGVTGKALPVAQQLSDFIVSLGFDPGNIPAVEFLDSMVPAELMPALYKAADAFILPTRGEGWGIPFTESMLMRIPVIATDWSGHLEFMNRDNSYLIDIDGIVPVSEEQVRDNPLYEGQSWAEPSVAHTRRLMRHVFENRDEARQKGRSSREHILNNFTIHHAAAKIADRLLHIEREKNRGRKRRSGSSIRVLFQARPNIFTLPGGDTDVLLKIKSHLENKGVDVDFSSNTSAELQDYDIVHIFNFDMPYALNAALQKKPYIVTPMYEDVGKYYVESLKTVGLLRDYMENGQMDVTGSAFTANVNHKTHVPPDHYFIAANAEAVLVSGWSEGKRIKKDFPNVKRIDVVNLGFDRAENVSGEEFIAEYGVKDFVLCVGRLETRKNQLMLLYALKDEEIPVVLINSRTVQPEYEEMCRKFRRKGKTILTGRLPKELLLSAYKAAKVHALPSWYELPGIVTLEAAWYGCNVVASDWGTIRDYLGDDVYYCEPHDPHSIRTAVNAALVSPVNRADLRGKLEKFTWENETNAVLSIYDKVLSSVKTHKWALKAASRIELAKKEMLFHQLRGNAYGLFDKNPREAIRVASQLLSFRANDPITYFIKGAACLIEMNYYDAEKDLKRVIVLQPHFEIKAYLYLSLALMRQGKYEEAAGVLRNGISCHPFTDNRIKALLCEYLEKAYEGIGDAQTALELRCKSEHFRTLGIPDEKELTGHAPRQS